MKAERTEPQSPAFGVWEWKWPCLPLLWSCVIYFYFIYLFNFLINLFIYLLLAVLGPRCCARALSSCGERGLPLAAVCGPLIVVASPAAEHGPQACRPQQPWHVGPAVVARGPQSSGSAVVEHRPSCSAACGTLPGQGSNPCPQRWQADSQPLRHQGSPILFIF